MGIGRCVNDDLLNELMQDTRCQLRDTALYVLDDPIAAEILVLDGRQNADSEEHHMKNTALVVIDLQSDITKNYRDIIEAVNAAIGWPV